MQLNEVEEQTLRGIIHSCLNQLYHDDYLLLQRKGSEQSAAFRFAIYFHEAIKQFDWLGGSNLDMEYNKNGKEAKNTPRKKNGTRPDLILHSRGDNERNILIAEFKGVWNKEGLASDIIKLEDFTDQGGVYAYGLGVLVFFTPEHFRLKYFKNGHEVD